MTAEEAVSGQGVVESGLGCGLTRSAGDGGPAHHERMRALDVCCAEVGIPRRPSGLQGELTEWGTGLDWVG